MATLALERSPSLAAQERAKGLASMLGFFGVERASTDLAAGQPIQRTRSAFDYLMKRRGVKTRYLYPDKAPMPLRGVEQARAFVLGPTSDESLIKKSAPGMKGREVYELAAEANVAMSLGAAFGRMAVGDDTGALCNDCPFDAGVKPGGNTVPRGSRELDALIAATWNKEGQECAGSKTTGHRRPKRWPLNLDTHTNNTCVVLAFEFEDTGEVFLFPADAQVGNWLSWQDLRWRLKSPAVRWR